jgi:virginiamycin B lyase
MLPACKTPEQTGGTPSPSASSTPAATASPADAAGNVSAQESTLEAQEKETEATTIAAGGAARRSGQPAEQAEKLRGRFTEFSLPPGSFPQFLAMGGDGAIYFAQGNANKIGRIASPTAADSGKLSIQDFAIPTPNSFPIGLVVGPDGAVWFTEKNGHKIGRLDPGSKSITEYATPTPNSGPVGIAIGSDGAVWFTEADANKIGRLDPKDPKNIREFPVPTADSAPVYITTGPDQAMWFAEIKGHKIGRVDASGAVQEYATTTPKSGPSCVIKGPDDALWVSELHADKIARFDVTTKKFTDEININSRKNGARSGPGILVNGPDGNIWFTEMYGNQISRINPKNKQVHEFTAPSSVKLEQAAAPSPGSATAGGGKAAWRDENRGAGGVSDTSGPGSIVASSDGTIWYTAMFAHKIARLRVSKA